MWNEKMQVAETQKKQTSDRFRKTAGEYCSLEFIFHSRFIPQAKGEDKKTFHHDTRSKQEFQTLRSKTFSSYTLGQNILLFDLEGAIIGSNSLILRQDGAEPPLWAPTPEECWKQSTGLRTPE